MPSICGATEPNHTRFKVEVCMTSAGHIVGLGREGEGFDMRRRVQQAYAPLCLMF